jgi:hypothetical protein
MTDYVTLAEVLAIHADQIERYGGSQGVRDAGVLEAALYWPQTGYYADLIEEAAALWEKPRALRRADRKLGKTRSSTGIVHVDQTYLSSISRVKARSAPRPLAAAS